jgi:predicted site-specific integrase-resolvase
MLTAAELAELLGIRPGTVKDWWRAGLVSGLRYNDKGEMLYHRPDPTNPPQPPKRGRPLKTR